MPFCQECGNELNEDVVYCEKCGTKLKRTYNKWIRGVSVIFGILLLGSSFSTGWQYCFESGLLLVCICEVLLTPLSICLILLGLFPDYANAKLSSWVDIESKYPEIVIGLIVVSIMIILVQPEPPEGWMNYTP